MKRIEPTFRKQAMTAEETEAFLDEMFSVLFDNEVNDDCDKIPNLALFTDPKERGAA